MEYIHSVNDSRLHTTRARHVPPSRGFWPLGLLQLGDERLASRVIHTGITPYTGHPYRDESSSVRDT